MLGAATPLQFNAGWGSPLWGLPLQFAWQHGTGRLFSNLSVELASCDLHKREVSTSAWWGAMNYFLSIIPFVAALESGVIRPVTPAVVLIAPPPQATLLPFCISFADCAAVAPNASAGWLRFFTRVREAQLGKPLNLTEAVGLMWRAHVHSLHEGLPLAAPLLPELASRAEGRFGESWASLVDFVAAMGTDVDYNETNFLQVGARSPLGRHLVNQTPTPWPEHPHSQPH